MVLFDKALKATVMTTELFIRANVSKKILYECLEIARAFERTYSAYKEDSLVSKINKFSGIQGVSCSHEELDIFRKALHIAELSNGAFDPTIGALTQGLYGFGTNAQKLPNTHELCLSKALVNYRFMQINNSEIYLQEKGMRLDLGGIGKGYVADKIIAHLVKNNASRGLVSVGGEICSFGKKYNIAIRNPFALNNIGVIKSSKGFLSISTSGDYERFIGSKENHHILDTTSAKANHYYSSVTIIKNGSDVTTLDGIATIVFNSPVSQLREFAKKFGVAIIAITPLQEILFENFAHIDIESFEIYPFQSNEAPL